MLANGYLKMFADLAQLPDYWSQILLDFPNHPASSHPGEAIPLVLYGCLDDRVRCKCCHQATRDELKETAT